MMKHVVIAIDGPAASGKSSVARAVARALGYLYVNSGSLYRAVTWAMLDRGVPSDAPERVREALPSLDLQCGIESGDSTVTIGGVDPAAHLSDEAVNRNVSAISAIPEVRGMVGEKLVAFRELDDVVMEGRDIATVVFPDTPHKFYVDASQEVRDARRRRQGLRDTIAERDHQDSSRATAPLVVPDGAHVIDSSDLTIEEVVERIVAALKESGLRGGRSGELDNADG